MGRCCTPGKYQGSSRQTSCSSCPAGKYSASKAPACTNCPAGKYQGSAGQSSCSSCPTGQYSSSGNSGCTVCAKVRTPLPHATATDTHNGSSSTLLERNCFIYLERFEEYSQCPPSHSTFFFQGKYNPSTGRSSCYACPSGQYQANTGRTSCTSCPGGQYQAYTSATSCSACPAGNYCPAGASDYTACAKGKYAAASASSCSDCAKVGLHPGACLQRHTRLLLSSFFWFLFRASTARPRVQAAAPTVLADSTKEVLAKVPAHLARRCVSFSGDLFFLMPERSIVDQNASLVGDQGYSCPAGSSTYSACGTGKYASAGSSSCTNCPAVRRNSTFVSIIPSLKLFMTSPIVCSALPGPIQRQHKAI